MMKQWNISMVIAWVCLAISSQAAQVKTDMVVSRDFAVRERLTNRSKTYHFTLGASAHAAGVAQAIRLAYGRRSQSMTNYRNNTVDWTLEAFTDGSYYPVWRQSDSYPSDTTYGLIPILAVAHVVDFGTARLPAGTRMRLTVSVAAGDYFNSVHWIRVQSDWKATPVITWANPQAIRYGTPLSATQLKAKTNVPGSWVYTPVVGTILSAGGQQTLTATFTPNDAARYNNTQKSVRISVIKATQKITFPTPSELHLGDADYPLTASASSGLPVSYASSAPAVATIVDGNKLHIVAAGKVRITASQGGDPNRRAAANVSKSLTIGTQLAAAAQSLKAPITRADSARYHSDPSSVTLTANPSANTLATTTSPADGLTALADDAAIRAFYAEMRSRIEAHNVPGFFGLFTPDYLHHGQQLADQFDDGADMLDGVESFTYDISDITVTGNDALVSGDFTFTFDDGDAPHAADETWPEPDLNDQTPGIGWLHKTADGWRVIGDQCTQR